MERLLDDARAGQVAVVVCDRLGRLGDAPEQAAETISILEGEGVHFVFLDEGVDAARLPKEPLASLAEAILDVNPMAGPQGMPASGDGLRVATYARVATAGTEARAVIDSQLRRAEEFVADQRRSSGWVVRSHVAYRDLGASGKDRDRPGLRQLKRDLAAGQLDVVICASLDRLARSVDDLLELLELFRTNGARLIALRDGIGVPIDPSVPPAVVEALSKANPFAGPRPRPGAQEDVP